MIKKMHTRSDETSKAYYLLEHPEEYPGLVSHQLSDRQFLLLQYPTFEPYASWSLFQIGKHYWVRRVEWDRSKRIPFHETDPFTYGSTIKCPQALAEDVLSRLRSLAFRPFSIQQEGIGLDGTTYGISLGDFQLSCDIQWWCTPPDEWNEVAVWFRTTVLAFENLLPESSCRCVKLEFDF